MTRRWIQFGCEHSAPRRLAGGILLLVLAAMVFGAPVKASAQPDTQPAAATAEDEKLPPPKETSPSDSYGAWGRLLLAMAMVVVLIVALGWLVKKMGGGGKLAGRGPLHVAARADLSPKHQVFLVRMGGRLLLIGAGPQGLTRLSEITDASEAAELLRAAGIQDAGGEGGKA
ncbi:MAG: flagellar biosynthetic protein FliO [Phycisphaerae bacterium]|nr:flagellar biosynthetic protein FliO [Phycisphaerae bacterium]